MQGGMYKQERRLRNTKNSSFIHVSGVKRVNEGNWKMSDRARIEVHSQVEPESRDAKKN